MNPLNIARSVVSLPVRLGAQIAGALLNRGGGGEPPVAERSPDEQPRRSSRPKQLDDVTIARKVESELFRSRSVPKGKIDVNVADGVVWLRGEAKNPAMVKRLEQQAASIPEVVRVENLLHLPRTPAPSRTDTPASQRKTRRTRPTQARRKVTPRKVTAERRVSGAEPSPAELASKRAGRKASPLGSKKPGESR